MKSIRRGLWDGEVEKDSRGQFSCWVCGQSLTVEAGAGDGNGGERSGGRTVRSCPECGRAWESK